MPSLEELLKTLPKEKRHKYVDESSDVNIDPVTNEVTDKKTDFETTYSSKERENIDKFLNYAQNNVDVEGVNFNNLKNIYNGSLYKATSSEDKFIKENFKALEDNVMTFMDNLVNAGSFDKLNKEQVEEVEEYLTNFSKDYVDLKRNAEFSVMNKRKKSQGKRDFDYFKRKDDEKKIWFDPEKSAVVDWEDYKKDSDLIVTGGKWYSDVAKDIEARSNKSSMENPFREGSHYSKMFERVQDVKLDSTRDPKDVYDKAYSILNDVDRPQEKLAVKGTYSYFQKVLKERDDKNNIEALTDKYFDGKSISYSKHRNNVRENVVHMLNSFVEFEDGGKNKETAIKLLESYENSDRDDKWFNQGTNTIELQHLSEKLTSAQSLYVFNKMEEGNSTLNNPYYFDNDNNIDEAKNNLNAYNNQIKKYLEEQKTLKSSLRKLDLQIRDEMLLETGVDKNDFFNPKISKEDKYKSVVLNYGYNKDGSLKSIKKIKEDFIKDNRGELARINTNKEPSSKSFKATGVLLPPTKSSWDDIGKYREDYTDPSDRLGNDDARLKSPENPYQLNLEEEAKNLNLWIDNSFVEDVHNELKERFGKDEGIVSKVYKNTLLENSVGYEGQEAVGFDYIDINDVENKKKSSLLSTLVDTAKTMFDDENENMSSNVLIKSGEIFADEKPSVYKKVPIEDRKKILTDFFKDSDKEENAPLYDLRFIDVTGDDNRSAYTIRKSGTEEMITMYFDKNLARKADQIFASNAYNNLNEELYKLQGYYDLSAYNTRNFKDLKLQNVDGRMYLRGKELTSGEEVAFDKQIGYADQSSVDDAIEHVKRHIIGFNNNK